MVCLNLRNNLQISIHCERRDGWRHFREPHVRPWRAWRRRCFSPPRPPYGATAWLQNQLNVYGNVLQNLRDELEQEGLEAQKKRLVDTFYNEVSRTYDGLRPESRIDYSQFGIDPDGKTLYWSPEDKKISIAATRGKFRFLGLATLARRYGAGGTYALRRSLGLPEYRSGASRGLGREVVETLQSAEEPPPPPERYWGNRAEGSLRRGWYHKSKRRRRRNRIEDH